MRLKKLLCTLLAAGLLSSAALAAEAPGYLADPNDRLSPILVWGQAAALDGDRISLENSDEGDPYASITVRVDEDTLILDAVTGEARTFADLRENETIYAYVSPAMTRSLPPIAGGILILYNIPADYAPPTYAQLQRVDVGEDGAITAATDRDVILHLSADTALLAGPGVDGAVTLDDIKPGATVLAWYQVVALSLPAQAAPDKVMVFPYSYDGYASCSTQAISINGAALALDAGETPYLRDGRLMVPLRKCAQALGCQVTWTPEDPGRVAVSGADGRSYALSLGGDTVSVDGADYALRAAAAAVDGVTFVDAGDLAALHNLKLLAQE